MIKGREKKSLSVKDTSIGCISKCRIAVLSVGGGDSPRRAPLVCLHQPATF